MAFILTMTVMVMMVMMMRMRMRMRTQYFDHLVVRMQLIASELHGQHACSKHPVQGLHGSLEPRACSHGRPMKHESVSGHLTKRIPFSEKPLSIVVTVCNHLHELCVPKRGS